MASVLWIAPMSLKRDWLTEGREHPQSVPSKNERAGNLARFAEFSQKLGEVSSWSQQPPVGPAPVDMALTRLKWVQTPAIRRRLG